MFKTSKGIIILGLVLLVYFSSCLSEEEMRIRAFETHLGKEKVEALDFTIKEFEEFLLDNFDGLALEECYGEYLKIISERKYKQRDWDFKNVDFHKINYLYESTGLNDDIWNIADEVVNVKLEGEHYVEMARIVNGDTVVISFSGDVAGYYYLSKISEDSIAIREKSYTWFKDNGKYLEGLQLVTTEKDSFITKYVRFVRASGDGPPSHSAKKLLAFNCDFNDYFTKVIIVNEFFKAR